MIQIYHNNRCTKSRCTLVEIEKSGQKFEVIHYLETPPNKAELEVLIQKLGIKPIDLIRKSESIYKEQYKGKTLNDAEWIDAMIAHPILIERPIVVSGQQAIIARPKEKIFELLK